MEHQGLSSPSGTAPTAAPVTSGASSAPSPFPGVVCAAEKCTIRVLVPCGHDMCRLHAPCSKRLEGKGSYWSREGCAVCVKAWESVCSAVDPAVVQPALASLRTWVGGFSRNSRGPYLDSDISRSDLFPKARPSAVVGNLPDAMSDLSYEACVSPLEEEVEEELLREPHSPGCEAVEVEDEPLDQAPLPPTIAVAEPQPGPSGYVPLHRAQPPPQDDRWEFLLREIQSIHQRFDTVSHPSPSSLLPPLSSCPETTKDNPWKPAEGFFSDDGLYHISFSTAFKVESLQFFPNRESYPNCYFRFSSDSMAGTRIPKETVLLPSGEVATILASLARSSGFSQKSMGSMGSIELVFESPTDAKLPFLVKAVKEVYKMFVDEDPSAFG